MGVVLLRDGMIALHGRQWLSLPMVMKIWLVALLVIVAQLSTGCASFRPTPYQPSVDGGYGYSDKQIGEREYRITVSGNVVTSADLLWRQLLFRAAEITLQREHEYFLVAPNALGELVSIEPAFLQPQFGLGPGGGGVPLVKYEGYPVGVVPSRQLIATSTIALTDRKQGVAKNVFSARAVKERLTPEIPLPR
jgi:hypothetical protein